MSTVTVPKWVTDVNGPLAAQQADAAFKFCENGGDYIVGPNVHDPETDWIEVRHWKAVPDGWILLVTWPTYKPPCHAVQVGYQTRGTSLPSNRIWLAPKGREKE